MWVVAARSTKNQRRRGKDTKVDKVFTKSRDSRARNPPRITGTNIEFYIKTAHMPVPSDF